jgi:hypothetical protein
MKELRSLILDVLALRVAPAVQYFCGVATHPRPYCLVKTSRVEADNKDICKMQLVYSTSHEY